MPRDIEGELRETLLSLDGLCVTFRLTSGFEVTGRIRRVGEDVVEIFAANQTVFVVINRIELFRPATGAAC